MSSDEDNNLFTHFQKILNQQSKNHQQMHDLNKTPVEIEIKESEDDKKRQNLNESSKQINTVKKIAIDEEVQECKNYEQLIAQQDQREINISNEHFSKHEAYLFFKVKGKSDQDINNEVSYDIDNMYVTNQSKDSNDNFYLKNKINLALVMEVNQYEANQDNVNKFQEKLDFQKEDQELKNEYLFTKKDYLDYFSLHSFSNNKKNKESLLHKNVDQEENQSTTKKFFGEKLIKISQNSKITHKTFVFNGQVSLLKKEQYEDIISSFLAKVKSTTFTFPDFMILGASNINKFSKDQAALNKATILKEKEFIEILFNELQVSTIEQIIEQYPVSIKPQKQKTPLLPQKVVLKQNNPIEAVKIEKDIILKKSTINNLHIFDQSLLVELQKRFQNQLWTDKYMPTNLSEMIGNGDAITQIELWLLDWKKEKKKIVKNQFFNSQKKFTNSCLVFGPPGVGKTLSIRLLAQKLKMEIVEWNASDLRNKSAVEQFIKPLQDNRLISFRSGIKNKLDNQSSIILMDEIDGMSKGDLGGSRSLQKIIKVSKNPFILICNNKYDQKIKPLIHDTFSVKFFKPKKDHIARLLNDICKKENLQASLETLGILAESSNYDIRQSLNILQMWSCKSNVIDLLNLNLSIPSFQKDKHIQMNIFEATNKLINCSSLSPFSIDEKLEIFFLNYEMMSLLIHENYLPDISVSNFNFPVKLETLEELAEASLALAESDIIDQSIKKNGNWYLLKDLGFLTSVYVPKKNFNTNFPKMAQFLGKMKQQQKKHRLLQELRVVMSTQLKGNTIMNTLEYVYPLMELIMYNLEYHQQNNIDKAISIMENYNIPPKMLKEHFILLSYKSKIQERFNHISLVVKSALKNAYNKNSFHQLKSHNRAESDEEEQDSEEIYHPFTDIIEDQEVENKIQS